MSEIATSEYEQARWVGSGVVGIPISAICEKWLYYYWPLFESAEFIPQIRGEAPGGKNPIAFRASMTRLIQKYHSDGRLTRFVLDYRSGALSPENWAILKRLIGVIRRTIVEGPVKHAGGSLRTGPVFAYDGKSKEIRFDAAIWRELSLVGHWITDATILRWAELTSVLSEERIRPSAAIDLLLTAPIPERDVGAARDAYDQLPTLPCTWTGVSVRREFAVDHIIPFSLWHNNDLWNLVPAQPKINTAKSDKLPTRELMLRRKDCLISHWETLRSAHKARFDHEAARLTGKQRLSADWQTAVFQSVADAIEFTAVQRGYQRWQP